MSKTTRSLIAVLEEKMNSLSGEEEIAAKQRRQQLMCINSAVDTLIEMIENHFSKALIYRLFDDIDESMLYMKRTVCDLLSMVCTAMNFDTSPQQGSDNHLKVMAIALTLCHQELFLIEENLVDAFPKAKDFLKEYEFPDQSELH